MLDRDLMEIPQCISLAQLPTPLQPLYRLQQQTGGPLIWLKRDDMTGASLSGNKVRKLEFLLAKAISEGFNAVITCGGIQSNHCRATAIAAAQLGLKCHLILRGLPEENTIAEGNQFLDKIVGASISYHSVSDYVKSLDSLFQQSVNDFAKRNIKALAIPTGGSNGVGVWGYIEAFNEISNDCLTQKIDPSAIVCATGSGGTQAGLVVGAALAESLTGKCIDIFGINVCDNEAWFINKINQDIAQWRELYPESASKMSSQPRINIIDGYVGEGYAKASQDIYKTIEMLGSLEGVILDPVYTGKAFDGMLKEIKAGRFNGQKDIVFIHTGGIFGLFPFAGNFSL